MYAGPLLNCVTLIPLSEKRPAQKDPTIQTAHQSCIRERPNRQSHVVNIRKKTRYMRLAFRRAQQIPTVKEYLGAWGEYEDEITGRYGNLEFPITLSIIGVYIFFDFGIKPRLESTLHPGIIFEFPHRFDLFASTQKNIPQHTWPRRAVVWYPKSLRLWM